MAKYKIDNRQNGIDFECNDDIVKRTLQNCKNLLMTRMGEVPYDRYRGFDAALLEKPISEINAGLMQEIDRVFMWEPDAEAVDAESKIDEKGDFVITVIVEINL